MFALGTHSCRLEKTNPHTDKAGSSADNIPGVHQRQPRGPGLWGDRARDRVSAARLRGSGDQETRGGSASERGAALLLSVSAQLRPGEAVSRYVHLCHRQGQNNFNAIYYEI